MRTVARLRSAAFPLALILVCLLLLLWGPLRHGTMPYGFDTIHQAHPELRWAFDEVRHGRIPAWNPYVLAGYPLMADPTAAGLFDPLNLAHLILPTPLAITASLLAHLFLSACLMYALQRRLGAGREGAALGALVWVLGGFVAGHIFLGELPHLAAASWAPGLLLCLEAILAGGSRWIVVAGGAVVAASLLAGHIQYGAMGIAAATIFLAGRIAAADRAQRWRLARCGAVGLGAMCLLGCLFAAPLLWPARAIITESGRMQALDWSIVTTASLPPWQLLTLVAPGFFGDVVHSTYWGEFPMELVTPYLGILPLVLVPFGVQQKGTRGSLPWVLMLVVGLVLAMGRFTPVYRLLASAIPGFGQLRLPARWLELFVLGASVLAGAGATRRLEASRAPPASPSGPRLEIAVIGVGALLLCASFVPRLAHLWQAPLFQRSWRLANAWLADTTTPVLHLWILARLNMSFSVLAGCAWILAAALALWLTRVRAASSAAIRWMLPALAAADLLFWSSRFVGPYDPADLTWRPAVLAALKSEPGPFRLATHAPMGATRHPEGLERSYPGMNSFNQSFMHRGMIEGVANVAGVFGAVPSRYARLTTEGYSFEHAFPDRRSVLDLLNVRLVLADRRLPRTGEVWEGLEPVTEDGDLILYRNPKALERAFLVPGIRLAETLEDAIEEIRRPGFDPRSEAIVEKADLPVGVPLPQGTVSLPPDSRAAVRSYGPRVIEIATKATAPSFLVLSDLFQDEWKARIDSRPATVLRVDVALRGLALPPGDHVVRFEYFPRRFVAGCAVSATSVLLLLMAWIVARRRAAHAPR